MREVFQTQLQEVQVRLVEMAEDTVRIMEKATTAFTESNVQLADEAIAIADQTGNKALIWEGHKAGRDIGYCHLEKLHNLEALPPTGFYISCFPHKIRGASAGWTRAVAIFDDALMASDR